MVASGMRELRRPACALMLVLVGLLGHSQAAGQLSGRPAELSEKESFMLMFGKGNGAMRTLCKLERDGVITQAQRRRYAEQLERWLLESGDSAVDRRNTRIGMAFADGRPSLCPTRVLANPKPDAAVNPP
jgi:hypothetical protein